MTQGKDAGPARRLTGRRAVWWAFLQTARDERLALAQERPISARNLRRLVQRRLGAATGRPVSENEILSIMHRLIAGNDVFMNEDKNGADPKS